MKISVKKDIGLGVKDSQPISVSIRIPKQEEVIKKPKITIPIVQEKQEIHNKEIIQLPKIIEPPKQTYGVIHNEQPVIKQEPSKEVNKDSIIDKINTGFSCDNVLHKDCPKPQWHQHLCKVLSQPNPVFILSIIESLFNSLKGSCFITGCSL